MPVRTVVAPSARALLDEATRRWPARSRASDGTIGDAAHAAVTSDHNPKPPDAQGRRYVDACDLTYDPAAGCDAHAWAADTAARGDERVKYLISSRRIWNPTSTAWATYRAMRAQGVARRKAARSALPGWRRYSGSNPHERHVHLSLKPGGRDDISTWWPTDDSPEEDDDMATADYRRALIRTWYQLYLGRAPESAEAQESWAERIAAHGADATQLAIADSDEAKARRGA